MPTSQDALGIQISGDQAGIAFSVSAEERMKHLYVLGSTGSGKTNLLVQLVEEDIKDRKTCIVLDMRGDLVNRVLDLAAGIVPSENIHLIDLRRPEASAGINPFQSTNDPYCAALHVHSVLRSSAESWGVQLDETLRCSLIALAFGKRSVADIPLLLTDSTFRAGAVQMVRDPIVKSFFDRFDSLSPEKKNAWLLPVLNKLSAFLSHPSIRALLSERQPIDFKGVLDTPGSLVLVSLAADRLHGLAGTFGCLVVSAIQNAVMQRVDKPEHKRNPVHLYLDEFENFQSTAFESIIAEGRRFRLGLTLSHQNLHQLDTRLRHVVINNAATKIYFRTGHTDAVELARELASYGERNPISSLMHQPVGEAFVIGDGRKARRIRFREAKRHKRDTAKLEELFTELSNRSNPVCDPAPSEPANSAGLKHVRIPRAAGRKVERDED